MSVNLETVDSNPGMDDPTPTLNNSTTLDDSEARQQNPEDRSKDWNYKDIKETIDR